MSYRFFLRGFLLVFVTGCSTFIHATMVTPPGSPTTKNAPLNEIARPGIVAYLNDGASSVRKQRREDAYQKMSDACNGRYTIDVEGEQMENGAVITTQNTNNTVVSQSRTKHYVYIQFSCKRDSSITHPGK